MALNQRDYDIWAAAQRQRATTLITTHQHDDGAGCCARCGRPQPCDLRLEGERIRAWYHPRATR